MDSVSIIVPSSSANVGLGYDIWSVGLEQPQLEVTYTRQPQGITYEAKNPPHLPHGRVLGYAGYVALDRFLRARGIDEGAHLLYKDTGTGFPMGGLGRSGAEAVGAIMAAAVLYDIKLTRTDVIIASAEAEGHLDNVAASVNGKFNIIARAGDTFVTCYQPDDLGIAIGFSSYQKMGGTQAGRRILRNRVTATDFVQHMGLVSAATAALVTGNTKAFLELAWRDTFHQPRRARVGFYGPFNDTEFAALQRRLFEEFHVAWNVSGAGPNMQAKYSKQQYPDGIIGTISPVVVPWFAERNITLRLEEMVIAQGGAYDYAQQQYDY